MDEDYHPRRDSSTERLVTVEEQIRSLSRRANERHEEIIRLVNEKHAENKTCFKDILDEQKKTNGRVTGIELARKAEESAKQGQAAIIKPIWTILSAILVAVVSGALTLYLGHVAGAAVPVTYPHFDQYGNRDGTCTWTPEGSQNCSLLPSVGRKQ